MKHLIYIICGAGAILAAVCFLAAPVILVQLVFPVYVENQFGGDIIDLAVAFWVAVALCAITGVVTYIAGESTANLFEAWRDKQ